jgi:hypothetical protein
MLVYFRTLLAFILLGTLALQAKSNDSTGIVIPNRAISDSNQVIEGRLPAQTKIPTDSNPIPDTSRVNPTDTAKQFQYTYRSPALSSRIHSLYPKLYDIPGNYEEILKGPSSQGPVSLISPYLGVHNPGRSLVHGSGGLWSGQDYEYDPVGLHLNGENGILYIESNPSILDTPLVRINWERGAFTGNSFRLHFRRLLSDSVQLELLTETHSTDSTGAYKYQDVTHQPYLSVLKRDSSLVPFTGRTLHTETSLIVPALVFFGNWHTTKVFAGFYSNQSQLPGYEAVAIDSLETYIREFSHNPYIPQNDVNSLGFESELIRIPGWRVKTGYTQTEINTQYRRLQPYIWSINSRDSIYDTLIVNDTVQKTLTLIDTSKYGTKHQFKQIIKSGFAEVRFLNWQQIQPSAHFNYEFQDYENYRVAGIADSISKFKLQQDRELGYFQLIRQSSKLKTRLQTGLQRNSSAGDEQLIKPTWALYSVWDYPKFAGRLWTSGKYRFADASQTHVFLPGRYRFANPDLNYEKLYQSTAEAEFKSKYLKLGAGLSHEETKNPVVPAWLQFHTADSLSDTLTYSEINAQHAEAIQSRLFLSLSLGNWSLSLEKSQTLEQRLRLNDTLVLSELPHLSSVFYRGQILWKNAFVSDRLGVSVKWDWEWIGERTAWALSPNNDHQTYPVRLPHNLMLDFEARMKIQNFQLYSRIDNFNHSLSTPDIGFTPVGLSFRWGILWELKN